MTHRATPPAGRPRTSDPKPRRRPRRHDATPPVDARRDDEVVDIASEDSFPASDPPALTPATIGTPVRKAEVAPDVDPTVPATKDEARAHEERDPERAGTAGRESRRRP